MRTDRRDRCVICGALLPADDWSSTRCVACERLRVEGDQFHALAEAMAAQLRERLAAIPDSELGQLDSTQEWLREDR